MRLFCAPSAFFVFMATVAAAAPPERGDSAKAAKSAVDRYGDPLPKGAIRRFGTNRLRHSGPLISVAFSPDGKSLVSTSWSNGDSIRLWNPKTGRLVRTFSALRYAAAFAAAFSPDGALLATLDGGGRVRVWDPAVGDELYNAEHHRGRVYGVAFSPDGKTFASAGGDGTIHVWDALKGKPVRSFHTSERVRDSHAVAYSPDGKTLATAAENTIHFWNLLKAGKPTTIEGVGGRAIVSLHYTPDGKSLISAGYKYVTEKLPDGKTTGRSVASIDIWDVKTRKKIRSLKDGRAPIAGCSTALSKDGGTLASVHRDRIRIWDVKSGKLRRTIHAHNNSAGTRTHGAAMSPDGKTLATIGPGRTVLLWDLTTGKRLHPFPDSHEDRVQCCRVSPDGKLIATASDDGTVRLWNAANGKLKRVMKFGRTKAAAVKALSFSPDGKRIAGGGYDYIPLQGFVGTVELWDVQGGTKLLSKSADDRVQAVEFSRDGKSLAVTVGLGSLFAGEPGKKTGSVIEIWSVPSGKKQAMLKGHSGRISWIVFSKDGRRLISADDAASIRVWNLSRRKQHSQFLAVGHRRDDLYSAAFSPDQKTVATSGLFGNRVILRNTESGKQLRQITVENSKGSVLAFSPDGRILATASFGSSPKTAESDNRIRLWDVATGKPLRKFERVSPRVLSLVFSADGTRIYSGMNDGTTLVWNVSAPKAK